MPVTVLRSSLPATAEEAYAWHTRAGALERLTPPWRDVRVLDPGNGLTEGSRVVLAVRAAGGWRRWVALHREVVPGSGFVDEQVEGPFGRWVHAHRFLPDGGGRCTLEDHVAWEPPLGAAGRIVTRHLAHEIAATLAFRHLRLREDLDRHASAAPSPLRVAVTGASGLVGSALVPFLTTGGHRVDRLVRGAADPVRNEIAWDPVRGTVDLRALEGVDAIVHLAGESIAAGRWTAARKRAILDSRVSGTRAIARAAANLASPPRALVCASAIGFYGDRGTAPVDEASPSGEGFLAEVVRRWEDALRPAEDAGIRVVRVRTGIVLSARGGVLGKLRLPFSMGLGGPVGSGRQGMSWILLDDLVDVVHAALADTRLAGPVNAVAPRPVEQRELARTLGRVLHRPAVLPLPAFAVSMLLGEMGRELLLSGAYVLPARLQAAGFRWRAPDLEPALRRELGRLGSSQ